MMSNDKTADQLSKIEEKINSFSEVLQNFGLNLIQNIGKINRSIHILTDKLGVLLESTTYVKSLVPQLNLVIEKQDSLENEMDHLKSIITNLAFPQRSSQGTERDETADIKEENAKEMLKELKELIEKSNTIEDLVIHLQESKESIYEEIGGHRILYEIQKTINDLKSESEVNNSLRSSLFEKIEFWSNRL